MGNAAKSSKKSPLTKETFRFFAQLARNNRKEWMDANRERYQECVVAPMRALLEALSPAIRELDDALVITGRTNENFSRINRDIRFAKDKTPYHTRIYLKVPDSTDGEGAELYVGVNREVVTAGFRIYGGSKIKESPLFKVGIQRALANPEWVARQKKRLGKKYESYWHSMERGDWTKNGGQVTCNHIKAVNLMKSVMWPLGDEEGTFDYSGSSQGILISETPTEIELREILLRTFCGQTKTFDQIVQQTWQLPFLEKHYRNVLKSMEGNEVTVTRISSKRTGITGNDQIHFPEAHAIA